VERAVRPKPVRTGSGELRSGEAEEEVEEWRIWKRWIEKRWAMNGEDRVLKAEKEAMVTVCLFVWNE